MPAATTGIRIHTDGLTSTMSPVRSEAATRCHLHLPVAVTYAITARDPISTSLLAVRSYAISMGIDAVARQRKSALNGVDFRER